MYRRSVLAELGGFDECLLTVEDEELDFRITQRGGKILYAPGAIVYHRRRASGRAFWAQMYRYAIGRAQFLKRHPRPAQWIRLLPSAWLLATLALALLQQFSSMARRMLLLELVLTISAWLGMATWLTKRSRLRDFPVFLTLLSLFGGAWAIGMLEGLWYRARSDGHTR